jgi:DNA-binding beta-propeller fold protein YncE
MWGTEQTSRRVARASGSSSFPLRISIVALSCMSLASCDDDVRPGTPVAFDAILNFGDVGISPGQFSYPRCLDNDGVSLWVVDKSARVQRLDPSTGASLGGWRMPAWSNGKPTGVTVWRPTDAADELVFVPDTHYHRVMVYRVAFDPAAAIQAATPPPVSAETEASPAHFGPNIGTLIASFGTYGEQVGQFIYPTDVAIVSTSDGKHIERLFVSEYGGTDRITIWKPKDVAISPLEGCDYEVVGSFGKFGSSATSVNVEFSRPQSLAIDHATKELVVTDSCNHRIGRFTFSGELIAWISGPENAGQGLGQMSYPYGLALAGDGTAFVAEFGSSRLQRFDLQTGRSLGIFSRRGRAPGEVMTPWGVTILDGKVYVLDSSNNRVQAFKLPKKPVAVSAFTTREGGSR